MTIEATKSRIAFPVILPITSAGMFTFTSAPTFVFAIAKRAKSIAVSMAGLSIRGYRAGTNAS